MNTEDAIRETPLHDAMLKNHADYKNFQKSAPNLAVRGNRLEIVKILILARANVNTEVLALEISAQRTCHLKQDA